MFQIYENQLQLDLYKSAWCYLYLALTGILVIFSLSFLSVNFYLKIFLIVLLAITFWKFIQQRNKIVSMKWFKGNRWGIYLAQGDMHEACLQNNSFVSRFICVLNFKLETGKSLSYTVFADSLHHEQMRRLLVRFKIEQSKLFSK